MSFAERLRTAMAAEPQAEPPQPHRLTIEEKAVMYKTQQAEQEEEQKKKIQELCLNIGQSLKAGENIYNIFLEVCKHYIAGNGFTAEYEQIKQTINKIYVKELQDPTAAECVYNLMLEKLNELYYIKNNNSLTEREDKNTCKSIERYTQELCKLDEIRKGES